MQFVTIRRYCKYHRQLDTKMARSNCPHASKSFSSVKIYFIISIHEERKRLFTCNNAVSTPEYHLTNQ